MPYVNREMRSWIWFCVWGHPAPKRKPAMLGVETAGVVDAIGGEVKGSVVGRNQIVSGGTV
jgi:NADPH:quinone reductase-like Zn-dependent oxidoreductase